MPNVALHAGEVPQTGIIASITPGATTLVYCVEEDRLGFQEGDAVAFSEILGMPELAKGGPYRVKTVKPYMLEIDVDSSSFTPHTSGAWLGFMCKHCCLQCIAALAAHGPQVAAIMALLSSCTYDSYVCKHHLRAYTIWHALPTSTQAGCIAAE